MQYLLMTLIGYKRLGLTGIKEFTITPVELIQLILGTNGSGKSSVVYELSPLPPNPADYEKHGSKLIVILKDGVEYRLLTTFQHGTKCTFTRDGVDLIKEGTQSAFKELVKQYFGITPQIHSLIIGSERFTRMSPSARREWFTLLSPVSYDYAISVYNKAASRSRDVSGALRLDKKRLVVETAKLLPIEEETRLRNEVASLQDALNQLHNHRAPVQRSSSAYLTDLEQLSKTLDSAVSSYTMQNGELLKEAYADKLPATTDEHFDYYINGYRQFISESEGRLAILNKQDSELQQQIDVLTETGDKSATSIQEEIDLLTKDIILLEPRRVLKLNYTEPHAALNSFHAISDQLLEIASNIPNNESQYFSTAKYEQANKDLELAIATRRTASTNVANVRARLEHLETHRSKGETICPSCNFRWNINPDLPLEEQLQSHLSGFLSDEIAANETVLRLERYISDFSEYRSQYLSYVRLCKATPALQPLWNHITERMLMTNSPRSVVSNMSMYLDELEALVAIHDIKEKILKHQDLLQKAKQISNSDIDSLLSQQRELKEDIRETMASIANSRSDLSMMTILKSSINRLNNGKEKLQAGIEEIELTIAKYIEALRLETIRDAINSLQSQLAIKSEALINLEQQRAIVVELEKTITNRTVEETALKTLVEELSPSEGLIADGLMSSINGFIRSMNALIRKFWSYPLVVHGCSLEPGEAFELDYKFPMVANTLDNKVSDVSKGSTGQQEIVDLSFKITALRYLGLESIPLVLDEFAASFDSAHRVSAMHAINNVIETQKFSQVFMISHYLSAYGSLLNAEVCVICENNIAIPQGMRYNNHVKIVR